MDCDLHATFRNGDGNSSFNAIPYERAAHAIEPHTACLRRVSAPKNRIVRLIHGANELLNVWQRLGQVGGFGGAIA